MLSYVSLQVLGKLPGIRISWASRATLLLLWSLVLCSGAVDAGDNSEADDMHSARAAAKPWYLRNITVNGVAVASPVSFLVVLVALINICYGFMSDPVWAEASHILLEDRTEKSEKLLRDLKKEIGSDYKKFGMYASKYSKCPSKNNNGQLGRFKKGVMAPPFNRAVFDPESPVGKTIGPIETQFGWHLIFITQRKLSNN